MSHDQASWYQSHQLFKTNPSKQKMNMICLGIQLCSILILLKTRIFKNIGRKSFCFICHLSLHTVLARLLHSQIHYFLFLVLQIAKPLQTTNIVQSAVPYLVS